MSATIQKLYWHDGNLIGVAFAIDAKGKTSVTLSAAFYRDEQARSRDNYEISCNDVSSFTSTLDSAELRENNRAGNISQGYMKEKTLWVYFADGILKVSARRFRLVKC
ncbi:MAG: hypothetical protein O9312_16340 [Hylemonella sp.]|nr:hypothetical protein [Hylemonella sp.]